MNSLNEVMVVGLTGQTGAGKSTVSKVFAENGFSVINADKIARLVVEKGSKCLAELEESFGDGIINENDELNRKALASIVFSDSKKLELLNTITYPYITREILKQIDSLSAQGELLILLDAPTLFESRADDFCELIISVIAHTDLRQQRIMERDSLTSEQALKRMNSQLTESFFIENSDFIIKNNKSMKNVFDISKEVSDKIKEYYYNKNNTQPEQKNSCACSE
ncbi:MAG: dephospho-CoA kinase [Ruminococcus sp.]|nr:dephospho-CoA kinase [Ruminococcus sp.]